MTVTRIYNSTPDTGTINKTNNLLGAIALYMIAPDIPDEYEIDFYLQLEISGNANRLIKLNDNFILDTVIVYPIPPEFQYVANNIYGAFITSLTIALEIWAIFPEISLKTISNQLAELAPASEIDNIFIEVLTDILPVLLPPIITPLLPGVPVLPPILLPGF